MSALKDRINGEVKASLKSGDKLRASTLRLMLAAMKQIEVDNRVELDDAAVVGILTKMTAQRRDSISQFDAANRQDLADKERAELAIIEEFLPTPLSAEEVDALIAKALAATGATQIKDMGRVMNELRPQLIGRADIGAVSAKVKTKLSS
jgi:uncharacterized protein